MPTVAARGMKPVRDTDECSMLAAERDSGNFDCLIRPTCCGQALENKGIISNMIAGSVFVGKASPEPEYLSHPAIQRSAIGTKSSEASSGFSARRTKESEERGNEGTRGWLVRGESQCIHLIQKDGRSGVNAYFLSTILGGNEIRDMRRRAAIRGDRTRGGSRNG